MLKNIVGFSTIFLLIGCSVKPILVSDRVNIDIYSSSEDYRKRNKIVTSVYTEVKEESENHIVIGDILEKENHQRTNQSFNTYLIDYNGRSYLNLRHCKDESFKRNCYVKLITQGNYCLALISKETRSLIGGSNSRSVPIPIGPLTIGLSASNNDWIDDKDNKYSILISNPNKNEGYPNSPSYYLKKSNFNKRLNTHLSKELIHSFNVHDAMEFVRKMNETD